MPRDACPSVRISVMVTTTVAKTISVAPKLRDSSLRNEEWNNIGYKSADLCAALGQAVTRYPKPTGTPNYEL